MIRLVTKTASRVEWPAASRLSGCPLASSVLMLLFHEVGKKQASRTTGPAAIQLSVTTFCYFSWDFSVYLWGR